MMTRLSAVQFRAIASLTLLDILRQPLCFLLSASAVLLMALASLQAYQFGEDGRIARDSALAIHFLFGILIGVYAACTALGGEMRGGTCAAALSKPVNRDVFFLSKFAAVAAAVLLYSVCSTAAILLCEKASPKLYHVDWLAAGCLLAAPAVAVAAAGFLNARMRLPFPSTAFWIMLGLTAAFLAVAAALYDPASAKRLVDGRLLTADNSFKWRIVPVAAVSSMAVLVLSAAALGLSARLGSAPVAVLCALLLFAGLLSEHFLRNRVGAAALPLRLIPDWQNFWLSDVLTAGGGISAKYFLAAAAQAILFLAAILSAGVLLFRRADASRGE